MSEDYRIIFEPMGLSVKTDPDKSILDVAASRDVPIRSDCGGKGLCGKCLVIAEPAESLSPLTEVEMELLTPSQRNSSRRLACQARIKGPLTVTIPEQLADSKEARGKSGVWGKYPVDSMVERLVLSYGTPSCSEDGVSSDMATWATKRVKELTNRKVCFKDHDALRQLSLPEIHNGKITIVNHGQRGVTSVLSGRLEKSLGLAIDIGTTTIAAYLCDLKSGNVLTSVASVNPQRRFGEDVISRIAVADQHESGLETLHALIIEGINFLITRCLENVGAYQKEIDEVVLVGNTTMQQLFAALHPHELGVMPYMPVVRILPDFNARELGLNLNPGTNVHLFPVISGFVGGDTMGAIVADSPHTRNEITLGVDIGTNGELVLGNRKGLWATSCATGPAFEGAQISCGMRAVSGAIHKVEIDPETFEVYYQVLGQGDSPLPIGICGSGIIDAVAAMRRVGVLLPNGRFKEGMPGVFCDELGVGRRFSLVPAKKSGTGADITITLKDIRQIQLAKAALAVGIDFLMRKIGVTNIDRTVLTGAFGAKFDWRNAIMIGMLPPKEVCGEVRPMENLAGVGAIMALLDKKRRTEAMEVSKRIKFLELAQEPGFAERFAEATFFPPLD